MPAEILHFPPRFIQNYPCSDFRKALMTIIVLLDFNEPEARKLIALWVEGGLLSEDEADALHTFYGWA